MAPPIVDIPSFEPPRYEPPVLNPEPAVVAPQAPGSRSSPSEDSKEEERELSPPVPQIPAPSIRPEVELPFVGTVPLPYKGEIALAGTTAIGATAAALVGKSLVEWLVARMKPVVKITALKIKEKLGGEFTDYEVQQFFGFEGRIPQQKVAARQLAKEQKREKVKQLEVHLQQQRRSKR